MNSTWDLLLRRSVRAPAVVGMPLFWSLHVEASSKSLCYPRFSSYIALLCSALPVFTRRILAQQLDVWGRRGAFARVCLAVKTAKSRGLRKSDTSALARRLLRSVARRLPARMMLPLDSRMVVGRLIPEKCRVMDSAKLPIWLVFESPGDDGDEDEDDENEEEEADDEDNRGWGSESA